MPQALNKGYTLAVWKLDRLVGLYIKLILGNMNNPFLYASEYEHMLFIDNNGISLTELSETFAVCRQRRQLG